MRVPPSSAALGQDGIPAIDKARFLSDDQPVFGLQGQSDERPRAYP
ncbi:hypothetical protein AB0N07_34475 [Streptomyces sp. NPDC051172]